MRTVLIGVDGGADTLIEFEYKPYMIDKRGSCLCAA